MEDRSTCGPDTALIKPLPPLCVRVTHAHVFDLEDRSRLRRFTIAQLLGHSDVRVTMRYVRMVGGGKRVAVEAMKLTFGKVGHVLATWPKQPQLPWL